MMWLYLGVIGLIAVILVIIISMVYRARIARLLEVADKYDGMSDEEILDEARKKIDEVVR